MSADDDPRQHALDRQSGGASEPEQPALGQPVIVGADASGDDDSSQPAVRDGDSGRAVEREDGNVGSSAGAGNASDLPKAGSASTGPVNMPLRHPAALSFAADEIGAPDSPAEYDPPDRAQRALTAYLGRGRRGALRAVKGKTFGSGAGDEGDGSGGARRMREAGRPQSNPQHVTASSSDSSVTSPRFGYTVRSWRSSAYTPLLTPSADESGASMSQASPGYASFCARRRNVFTCQMLTVALLPLVLTSLFVIWWGIFGRVGERDFAMGSGPGAGVGLSFLVVGDWGRDGKRGQTDVAAGMAKVVREKGVRFLVSSGDNFYDAGVDNVDDPRWKSSFENVYRDASLRNLAFWSTLGNHDHLGDISAQVKYSGHSRRWTMPNPYYEFTAVGGRDVGSGSDDSVVPDVQFIFLDSTPYTHDAYGKAARHAGKQVPNEQTKWLEKTLEESTAPYVIIVVHHCMYTMSTSGHLGTPELRAHIEPLLLRHRSRVLAVITGHEHALMHMQPYGNAGSWSGSASTILPENATEASARSHQRDHMFNVEPPGRVLRYDVHGSTSRAETSGGPEGRRRPPGTTDHFISGGGSAIDTITESPANKAGVWESCCGVLSTAAAAASPRGIWAKSAQGFFVFTITHDSFWAIAYSEKGRQLYAYSKPI